MLLAGKEAPVVMLTGRRGQIGSEFEKQLPPFVRLAALDRKQCDLGQPNLVRSVMRDLRPDLVINAAGYTAVDQAETDPALAAAVNTESVRVMAEEAGPINALLVHYSTDYVFDGTKDAPYVESDLPNPLNVYGRTKLAGEQAIQGSGCSYLIFRTTWIYAATGKNFLTTIARLAQKERELRIVSDQHGAPTAAREVVRATLEVLAKASLPVRELYHMTAGGETTWYGLAQEIVKELGRRCRQTAALKPVTTAEYPVAARRPRNSLLSNERLRNDFAVRIPHWSEGLQATLRDLVA